MSLEQDHSTKGLLRLTMACNERCTFCNVPVENYLPQVHTPEEAVAAQLEAFFRSGEKTLTLSGGEPTLQRARLLRWVRTARAQIPFVELQTNAILIDDAYASDLAEAGVTSAFVSLLSHSPALHDALTQVEGSYKRCLRGIRALDQAGIRVTLNPVFTAATEHTIAEYVRFVHTKLPVSSISLSFMQPHGRSDENELPDYSVVSTGVREALRYAEDTTLRIVNPYCGLPLCVGWENHPEASVEAVGSRDTAPGVMNQGDKRHGAPCRDCALRTRCGGAWHAYWRVREGAGIHAPVRVITPWEGSQDLLTWHRCRRLQPHEIAQLLTSGITDIAVDWSPQHRPTLAALRHLATQNQRRSDAQRCNLWLALPTVSSAHHRALLELAAALDVHGVWITDPRLRRRAKQHYPNWIIRGG